MIKTSNVTFKTAIYRYKYLPDLIFKGYIRSFFMILHINQTTRALVYFWLAYNIGSINLAFMFRFVLRYRDFDRAVLRGLEREKCFSYKYCLRKSEGQGL